MEILRHKNQAFYLSVPMVDSADPDSYKSGITPAAIAYYKDSSGPWTNISLSSGSLSEIGATGVYAVTVSQSESNHDQLLIKITDAAAQDSSIIANMIPIASDVEQFGGNLISDNSAILKLKTLDIANPDGSALKISGDYGLECYGSISGAYVYGAFENNAKGFIISGDGTGGGVVISGGATSGTALSLTSIDSNVVSIIGTGGANGIDINVGVIGLNISSSNSYAIKAYTDNGPSVYYVSNNDFGMQIGGGFGGGVKLYGSLESSMKIISDNPDYSAIEILNSTGISNVPLIKIIGGGGYAVTITGGVYINGYSGLPGLTINTISINGSVANSVDDFRAQGIGTPTSLDGSSATIAGMLLAMADDSGGSSFDSSNDSLAQISNHISNIAIAGSAVNQVSYYSSFTAGSTVSGSIISTHALDSSYYQIEDSAGAGDFFFEYNIGGGAAPVNVTFIGHLNGLNDDYSVFAWNWNSGSWQQIGSWIGAVSSDNVSQEYTLLISHVNNLGVVRIRFYSNTLTSSDLYIDQTYISYTNVSRSVGYSNGSVWVDTSKSNSGTELFVDGVADNPVGDWNSAQAIASSLGLKRFSLIGGSSITMNSDMSSYYIYGPEANVNLNGQTITHSFFDGPDINGVASGYDARFMECRLLTVSTNPCGFWRCSFAHKFTAGSSGDYIFDNCSSVVAGMDTPIIDFSSYSVNVNLRHYSGGILLENMKPGDNMSIEGHGQIKLGTTSIGGALAIRGHFKITDYSGGAITLSDDVNFKTLDEVDGRLSSSHGVGSWLGTTSPNGGSYQPFI